MMKDKTKFIAMFAFTVLLVCVMLRVAPSMFVESNQANLYDVPAESLDGFYEDSEGTTYLYGSDSYFYYNQDFKPLSTFWGKALSLILVVFSVFILYNCLIEFGISDLKDKKIALFTIALFTTFPIYFMRTLWGNLDTDSVIVFCFMIMIVSILRMYSEERSERHFAIFSFIASTILLLNNWTGWFAVFGMCLVAFIISNIYYNDIFNWIVIGVYSLAFLLFNLFTGKLSQMINVVLEVLFGGFTTKVTAANNFPNIYPSIAELTPMGIKLILYVSPILIAIAFIGTIVYMIKSEYQEDCSKGIILLALMIITMVLGLVSVRFIIFMAGPFSVGAFLFIKHFWSLSENNKLLKPIILTMAALSIITGILIAIVSLGTSVPQANDSYIEMMDYIMNDSNGDCLIISWWDLGYVYKAYSGCEILIDPGNQAVPNTYYVAVELMNTNNTSEGLSKLTTNFKNAYLLITPDMNRTIYWWSYFGSWDRNTLNGTHYNYTTLPENSLYKRVLRGETIEGLTLKNKIMDPMQREYYVYEINKEEII